MPNYTEDYKHAVLVDALLDLKKVSSVAKRRNGNETKKLSRNILKKTDKVKSSFAADHKFRRTFL